MTIFQGEVEAWILALSHWAWEEVDEVPSSLGERDRGRGGGMRKDNEDPFLTHCTSTADSVIQIIGRSSLVFIPIAIQGEKVHVIDDVIVIPLAPHRHVV